MLGIAKTKDIKRLEKTIETLNENLEKLIETLQKHHEEQTETNPITKFRKLNRKLDNIYMAQIEQRIKRLEEKTKTYFNDEEEDEPQNLEEIVDRLDFIPRPLRFAIKNWLSKPENQQKIMEFLTQYSPNVIAEQNIKQKQEQFDKSRPIPTDKLILKDSS